MLAKNRRLAKEKDFKKTFKQGKSFYAKFLAVKALANELANNRYGLIISAKVSKKAVERNKLKRQIRAIIKAFEKRLITGHDLIIMVLPAALGQDYLAVKNELEKALAKLKMLRPAK